MDQTQKDIQEHETRLKNCERDYRIITRTQEKMSAQLEGLQQLLERIADADLTTKIDRVDELLLVSNDVANKAERIDQVLTSTNDLIGKIDRIKQSNNTLNSTVNNMIQAQNVIIQDQNAQKTSIDSIKSNQGSQQTTIAAITGTILPQFTIQEEKAEIARASNVDIYKNTTKFGLDDEIKEIDDEEQENNNDGQAGSRWMREHTEKKRKSLLHDFTPKLSQNAHLAEWYTNFEFYARCHKIPKSIVESRFIIDLVDDNIRNKYLLEKEIKGLENKYKVLQKWLFDPTLGKKQILKQKEAIFKWKNSHNTIKEAYNSFLLTIRAYSRELAFAKQNGIPEFQFDRPSEAALVKYFIANVPKAIANNLTRTLTKMEVGLNMSLLKLACDKIAKSEETLLGMDIKGNDTNVKMEALITERVDKQVNEILAVKAYNNWGSSQGRGQGLNGGYNNRTPNTFNYGPRSNRNNRYNNRGRGRGRRGRWGNRRFNNARTMKFRRGGIKCHHCKKRGHKIAQCWIKYPHLKKSFFERIKNERTRKSLFVIDYDVDGYLAVGPQDNPWSQINDDVCQHEVFLMTSDDFDFEAVQQGYESRESTTNDRAPSTDPSPPNQTNPQSEEFNDSTADSHEASYNTSSLATLLNNAVSLDRPQR